jgi:hypothetical protein
LQILLKKLQKPQVFVLCWGWYSSGYVLTASWSMAILAEEASVNIPNVELAAQLMPELAVNLPQPGFGGYV